LSDDESDARSDFHAIFSNKTSDIGSSITPSDSVSSSESEPEDESKSDDSLALEDEEKQLAHRASD
jgi:hypothetical protein